MTGQNAEPDKLCFVVGPIGTEDSPQRIGADWLLEMIIQPVFKDFPQFEVKRADTISDPGMIDAQVINALLNADLVIADLSTLNPNAFYEIGIRHMAQRPIVHMQVIEESIPFDVSLFRSIKYSRIRPRDLRTAQAALKGQIEAILAPGYQVDNPVTRTRGTVALEQGATSGEKVLLEQIRAMESRLSSVERRTPLPRNAKSPSYGDEFRLTQIVFKSQTMTKSLSDDISRCLGQRFKAMAIVGQGLDTLTVLIPGSISVEEISGRLPAEVQTQVHFDISSKISST